MTYSEDVIKTFMAIAQKRKKERQLAENAAMSNLNTMERAANKPTKIWDAESQTEIWVPASEAVGKPTSQPFGEQRVDVVFPGSDGIGETKRSIKREDLPTTGYQTSFTQKNPLQELVEFVKADGSKQKGTYEDILKSYIAGQPVPSKGIQVAPPEIQIKEDENTGRGREFNKYTGLGNYINPEQKDEPTIDFQKKQSEIQKSKRANRDKLKYGTFKHRSGKGEPKQLLHDDYGKIFMQNQDGAVVDVTAQYEKIKDTTPEYSLFGEGKEAKLRSDEYNLIRKNIQSKLKIQDPAADGDLYMNAPFFNPKAENTENPLGLTEIASKLVNDGWFTPEEMTKFKSLPPEELDKQRWDVIARKAGLTQTQKEIYKRGNKLWKEKTNFTSEGGFEWAE